ncbi:hypothetical protein WR25_23526 [Diploscapter pachys]|uniref:Uncharacterized protein n=1 Tax=Diploscapter pachys TaxID=2018661 RepID=A0A2A2KW85_9BILA|nr:hypothetical protein WR25_23526 [Diploscapter pachys]
MFISSTTIARPNNRFSRFDTYPRVITGVGFISTAGKIAQEFGKPLSGVKIGVHNGLDYPIRLSCHSKKRDWVHTQVLGPDEWFLFDFHPSMSKNEVFTCKNMDSKRSVHWRVYNGGIGNRFWFIKPFGIYLGTADGTELLPFMNHIF